MTTAAFTLVQLRYFTESARSGSMTEAARRLHVSQPALSAAINQLERDLGVTLFERVPRKGIRLTPAGRQFHLDAVSLLAHSESMAERVGSFEGTLTGTLRIGLYLPMAPFRAPTLVHAFTRRHPQIALELVEADHDELGQMLSDHDIDVAVAYDMAPFENLHTETLEEMAPHVLVPPEHPLAGSTEAVPLDSFAADPLILLDLPHTASYYLGLFRSVGVEARVRFRVRGYETVRGLVGRGFGVSVLNQRIAHDLSYGGTKVAVVEISDELPGLRLNLVTRVGEQSQRVDAFAEVCRRLYASETAGS